jgi:DNA repair protein RadC
VVSVRQGTLDEALAHPREVFKPVIAFSAYAFIMVHNHPSGDPFPFRSVEEGARGQR